MSLEIFYLFHESENFSGTSNKSLDGYLLPITERSQFKKK